MKLHSGISARHLLSMLGETLHKEQTQWKALTYKKRENHQQEVVGAHRDEVVSWLIFLNGKFHFTPETVCLSIYLLDKFLHLVKVRPKYVACVAISCYFIAAKTLEEDEVIPGAVDLVKTSQCSCTVAEVLRMEAIILNKLEWNIRHVTSIDILHIIHGMLMCYYPQLLDGLRDMTPSQHLGVMTRKLFNCLGCHQLQEFPPSVLSLAVVSLELEQIVPNWLSIIVMIQQMAQIENESLIRCREMAGQFLTFRQLLPTGYHFLPHYPVRRFKNMKRKAEQVQTEDEDIYNAIKRLFSEDVPEISSKRTLESGADTPTYMRLSCGSEVLYQDTEGSNPSLKFSTVSAN